MLTTASMKIVGFGSWQFVLLLYYINSLVIMVYEDISVVRVTKYYLIMNYHLMK